MGLPREVRDAVSDALRLAAGLTLTPGRELGHAAVGPLVPRGLLPQPDPEVTEVDRERIMVIMMITFIVIKIKINVFIE